MSLAWSSSLWVPRVFYASVGKVTAKVEDCRHYSSFQIRHREVAFEEINGTAPDVEIAKLAVEKIIRDEEQRLTNEETK